MLLFQKLIVKSVDERILLGQHLAKLEAKYSGTFLSGHGVVHNFLALFLYCPSLKLAIFNYTCVLCARKCIILKLKFISF